MIRSLVRSRRGALVLALWAAACSSTPPEEDPEQAEAEALANVALRKRRMLLGTENAIQHLVAEAGHRIEAVWDSAFEQSTALPASWRLNVVDPELEPYGGTDRDEFRARVAAIEGEARERLTEILSDAEGNLWLVAETAGQLEKGSGFGFRSGYAELDDKVEAALRQLERQANLDGVTQLAALRSTDRVDLNRTLRMEIPGIGLFALYLSAPTDVARILGQDPQGEDEMFQRLYQTVAQAVSLRRAPEAVEVPVEFRQAVRYRVERGGIVLYELPWRFDPSTANAGGILPLSPEITDPRALATLPVVPQVDFVSESLDRFRSHTLVAEYRTSLVRTDTGEVLGTLAWQVAWSVDYRTQLRVVYEESQERIVGDDTVVFELMQAMTPPSPGEERMR